MPSFYYSATLDESLEMLRELIALGFRVIPSGPFGEPLAPQHAALDPALEVQLRRGPGFELAGDFTRCPVALQHLTSGPASGKYVVNPLVQGPVIEGLLARDFVVDGEPTILLGFLSRQTQYRNPETQEWEPASPEVKAAYQKAVAFMKKRLVKDERAKFPIGREALRRVQGGEAKLQQSFVG